MKNKIKTLQCLKSNKHMNNNNKTHGTEKKKKKSEFAETSLLFPNGWTPDETDHLPVFPAERQTLLVPKKNNMEPHTFSWRKPSGYKHTAGSQ